MSALFARNPIQYEFVPAKYPVLPSILNLRQKNVSNAFIILSRQSLGGLELGFGERLLVPWEDLIFPQGSVG